MCPSSGEIILSIWHLVYVTLCRWPYDVQVWMSHSLIQTCTPNGHLFRVTYTRCHIDTISSLDDGHNCPKHVENRNEHTRKRIVHQVGYLQRLWFWLFTVCHKLLLISKANSSLLLDLKFRRALHFKSKKFLSTGCVSFVGCIQNFYPHSCVTTCAGTSDSFSFRHTSWWKC